MEIGTVQRAFQLAPDCTSLQELRRKLSGEGYTSVDDHLRGSLGKELAKLLKGQGS
jgi:hypothetical protein